MSVHWWSTERLVTGRGLVAFFTAATLVLFVGLGLVLHHFIGEQVAAEHRRFAEFHALFTVGHVLAPNLDPADFAAPATDERERTLRRLVDESVLVGDVVGVKLWGLDGTVTFADDASLVGRRFPDAIPQLQRAVRADIVSEVEEEPHGGVGDSAGDADVVMESYVRVVDGGRTIGVAELYQDYGPTLAAVAASTGSVDDVLLVTLLAFLVLTVPLVARTARAMSRQSDRLLELLGREQETVERLTELDETKNLILAAVSHELRTPLTVLRGGVETLRRHEGRMDPDTRGSLLQRLDVQAARLEQLLGDLLDLGRLSRGVIVPARTDVALEPLVASVVDAIDMDTHDLHVDVRVPRANVGAAQVGRILENLMRNAVRHTPPGTTIWVRAHPHDEGLLLVVEDDGPGVPEHARKRIFEPFEHGPGVLEHAPGTGVGLSLVAKFAELHGGRAWLGERPGGGARFHVLLPEQDVG